MSQHSSPQPVPARPTTAPQATHPTPQPAQIPQAPPQPAPLAHPTNILNFAPPQAAPQTHREKLRTGDPNWPWQLGLRAITIIVGIIGTGCAAWAVSKYTNNYSYDFDVSDSWAIPWALITFSISVIWSAICILVFLLRNPNRPVHPGVRVGVDLILWLAFIPTAMFTVVAVMSVMEWGQSGRIGYYYSSDGYYTYSSGNNTWTWQVDSDYTYYSGEERDCSSSGYYTIPFSNCAEQDAYVNQLWREKDTRFNTEMTACVCQFIALVAHLALFIWACVDTHYRNSRKVSKEAEQLAADIVMNMVRSGAIIQPPGAAQLRPMGQQWMPPPPQMQMQPPQRSPLRPQPTPPMQAVASSSDEKNAGPRYA